METVARGGSPPGLPSPRVSDRTAFFSVLVNPESDTRTGVLVEYGRTQQIFGDPEDPRTKAYVTGRVG